MWSNWLSLVNFISKELGVRRNVEYWVLYTVLKTFSEFFTEILIRQILTVVDFAEIKPLVHFSVCSPLAKQPKMH